ncbi:UNVERIFIED_CONTAM: hypothetical protein K2H54_041105 [Gekko kuhli]
MPLLPHSPSALRMPGLGVPGSLLLPLTPPTWTSGFAAQLLLAFPAPGAVWLPLPSLRQLLQARPPSPASFASSRHFEYNGMKEICFGSSQQLCFDVRHEKVVLQNCTKAMENSSQHWNIEENGMIVHNISGKCIEAMKTDLCLRKCKKDANMIWQFHPDDR